MKLPPHTASKCDVCGYERIDWHPPSAGLPPAHRASWLAPVNRDTPEFRARVTALRDAQAALKPWTLLAMPGESHQLVARRRTLWWRVVTWWLNRRRRKTRDDAKRRMAWYFDEAQVAARKRASQ